jgi:hypothetical protein
MADVMTRADSIREYHTEAAGAGNPQPDPNLSLGGFRSSDEAESVASDVTGLPSNLTIDFISLSNQLGQGELFVVDADTVRWKSFGQNFGSDVLIANGESKVIEENGNPGAFIRITRTSVAPLVGGTVFVTLSRKANTVYSLDDVTSVEALAGDNNYRAIMGKNEAASPVTNLKYFMGTLGTSRISADGQLPASGAGNISDNTAGAFADWPTSGWVCIRSNADTVREVASYTSRTDNTLFISQANHRQRLGTVESAGLNTDLIDPVPGIALGYDPAGVLGPIQTIQTIANEAIAPNLAPNTWVVGLTDASGIDIGTVAAGEEYGIWIWRDVPPNAVSIAENAVRIHKTYDAA